MQLFDVTCFDIRLNVTASTIVMHSIELDVFEKNIEWVAAAFENLMFGRFERIFTSDETLYILKIRIFNVIALFFLLEDLKEKLPIISSEICYTFMYTVIELIVVFALSLLTRFSINMSDIVYIGTMEKHFALPYAIFRCCVQHLKIAHL